MPQDAKKSPLWETCHFPPLASSGVLPVETSENMPAQSLAEGRYRKTDNAELLRELTRAKVAFQLRTIKAVLGGVG